MWIKGHSIGHLVSCGEVWREKLARVEACYFKFSEFKAIISQEMLQNLDLAEDTVPKFVLQTGDLVDDDLNISQIFA